MEKRSVEVSNGRRILALIATLLLVVIVWKVIDYRTQAPPPSSLIEPSSR